MYRVVWYKSICRFLGSSRVLEYSGSAGEKSPARLGEASDNLLGYKSARDVDGMTVDGLSVSKVDLRRSFL